MSNTAGENGTQEAPQGTEEAPASEPTIESLQAEIESLKGHSRKWEDRAKANAAAKKELDELKVAAMSDEERRVAEDSARAQALADAEARALKAEADKVRLEVAVEFSLSKEDAEALSGVTDPAALRALAERLSGRSSGPKPNPAQGRTGSGSMSPRDAGIAALGGLFGD